MSERLKNQKYWSKTAKSHALALSEISLPMESIVTMRKNMQGIAVNWTAGSLSETDLKCNFMLKKNVPQALTCQTQASQW